VPAVVITNEDLAPFADIPDAKAAAMIEDALAMAAQVAPCILDDAFTGGAAAKAVLRGAILRWNDSGSGALSAETTGPFSVTMDTRTPRRSLFWPSEIDTLTALCRSDTEDGGAFSVDTALTSTVLHATTCALNFGAQYCSCGAVLTGNLPLYDSIGDY
jgi:hypothetical protein